jgi:hypothetical protein
MNNYSQNGVLLTPGRRSTDAQLFVDLRSTEDGIIL